MKKNSVLYHSLGLFAAPLILVCILTAIASFATRKYEYLPEELNFISYFFFDASSYLLDFSMYFCLGAFCFAVYDRKIISAVVCALITLFHAGLLPILMFFVRSIFLADISSSNDMSQYWEYDVQSSMANFTTASVAIVILLAVTLVYCILSKREAFERPYIIPKSEPSVAALCVSCANMLYATLFFTFSGDYDIPSLIMQLAVGIISYFVMILGEYVQKKVIIAKTNKN